MLPRERRREPTQADKDRFIRETTLGAQLHPVELAVNAAWYDVEEARKSVNRAKSILADLRATKARTNIGDKSKGGKRKSKRKSKKRKSKRRKTRRH